MNATDTSDARPGVTTELHRLVIATAAEAAIVIGHFLYSARLYDDPYRAHPVVPVIVAFGLVSLTAGVYAWKRWRAAQWLLVAVVGVPFILLFGGYHGGFSHVLKLALFAAGMSPERLQDIFDSPDFAIPNDFAFEASGMLCFVAAVAVTWTLVRVLRASRHARVSLATLAAHNA